MWKWLCWAKEKQVNAKSIELNLDAKEIVMLLMEVREGGELFSLQVVEQKRNK